MITATNKANPRSDSEQGRHRSGPTVRVSSRELAETTRWAFVGAGCSSGEAIVAGRIVQLAEVEYGCGVDAADRELRKSRFSSEPINHSGGTVDVITDDHGRGMLSLAPLAAALAGTKGPGGGAVVLADIDWHPVMAAVLVEVLHQSCPGVAALAAWPLVNGSFDSAADHGATAVAGSARVGSVDPSLITSTLSAVDGLAATDQGIVFASLGSTEAITRQAYSPRTSTDGVFVEESAWARLCEAARQFLVVDE